MLVLQRSVKMVCSLPEVMGVSFAFMLVMLSWLVLWSFGVAGVIALSIGDGGRWWLLVMSWQVFALYLILTLGFSLYQVYWLCCQEHELSIACVLYRYSV